MIINVQHFSGKKGVQEHKKEAMSFTRESYMEKLLFCVYLWKQIILSLAIYTSQEVICKTLINILKRQHTGKST